MAEILKYDQNDLRAIESAGRFDANESIHFARQLEYIKSQIYSTLYAPRNALAVMPVSTDIPAGANSFVWYESDRVGKAKIGSNLGNDVPRADVFRKENTGVIRNITIGFGYNQQEIAASAFAGTSLTTDKAAAAVESHTDAVNNIAWFGDTENNLPGLFTTAGLPEVTIAADGAASSKTLSSKSADKIVRDINSVINAIVTQTKGLMTANEFWLPVSQYTLIASTQNSTASDTTILGFLRNVHPSVTFRPLVELTAAGGAGVDRMYAVANNAMNYALEIPMMLQTSSPQLNGYEFVVPMRSRIAGCVVKRPLAFAYGAGI